MYKTNFNDYRYRAEFAAYAVQLRYPPATSNPTYYADLYAYFIRSTYDLPPIYGSQQEIKRKLLKEIDNGSD